MFDKLTILFIAGGILGIIAESGLYGLIAYIIRKSNGMHVFAFRYLFFRYMPDDGLRIGKFMPICDLTMTKEDLQDDEDKRMYVIPVAVSTFVNAIFVIITLTLRMDGTLPASVTELITGMAAWCVISSAFRIIMGVKFLGSSEKMLFHKTKEMARRVMAGEPLENIDIPDYRTLDCIATANEIVMYQCYAFMKAVWEDNIRDIPLIVLSIEQNMKVEYDKPKKDYLINQIPAYYDLLYHYSAIALNKKRAQYIYGIIGNELKKDKDANGLRVLAYYTYYIKGDDKKAYDLLSEAIEALPAMKYQAERLFEDKLINRLIPIVNESIEKNHPYG